MTNRSTILIVDDEPRMLEVLEVALQAAGYRTVTAADAGAAWRSLTTEPVALMVLDIMLPGTSGTELCRRVREHSDVPIVLLTALGGDSDRVQGLEAGADDYVTKPFSPRELVLRVAAILRRVSHRDPQAMASTRRSVGELRLDATQVAGSYQDRDLHLTATEFRLLWLLMERPGETVGVELLTDSLGSAPEWGGRGSLRTAIYRLRGKLTTPTGGMQIVTDHGRGYRLIEGR
ncbi:response regulator transcription factor [Micropruina sp.]|uniref:response regulator transcription factor n=1 Tax=Micropruina sp. TaxID=2737536 RepID=UPI0026058511|nr:response regulator transcription factor [Micropruina sp.]